MEKQAPHKISETAINAGVMVQATLHERQGLPMPTYEVLRGLAIEAITACLNRDPSPDQSA